jgi:hypothetical protein
MAEIICIVCGGKRDDYNAVSCDGKVFCSDLCYNAYYIANNIKITIPPITSNGLTNAELRASPLSVNIGLTDAQLRASAIPVSGNITVNTGLTNSELRASVVPVITTPWAVTKVMKTGNKVTTAVTADQEILTYTVTTGKTLYLQYLKIDTRLTTFAVTATNFGLASLENPSGTKLITQMQSGAGITLIPLYIFNDIPIPSGTVIRVVCTPSAVTSYTWQANIGGYEL